MSTRVALAFGAVLACGAALAQDAPRTFDVASLKQSQPTPPYPVVLGITVQGTTTLTDVTLVQALMFALGLTGSSQIVSPAWTRDGSELFNIVAKAPVETPPDQNRRMTLNLLTERFHLTMHHEPRELPYYELTVDKKGPRLRAGSGSPDHPCTQDSIGRVLHAGRACLPSGAKLRNVNLDPLAVPLPAGQRKQADLV